MSRRAVLDTQRLGLRENLGQFSLLVVVNAFVGALVGMERTLLPPIAEQEFQLHAKSAVLSFIVVFGLTKALETHSRKSRMVEISLSGSGEGPGRAISRGYSTTVIPPPPVVETLFQRTRRRAWRAERRTAQRDAQGRSLRAAPLPHCGEQAPEKILGRERT